MTPVHRVRFHCVRLPLAALTVVLLHPFPAAAQDAVPAPFRGDWVAQTATCQAASTRLRVADTTLTLVNGTDTQTWSNLGVPTTFFGPDYRGISVVVLPDYDKTQPFTVYFNADEKRGVTVVDIYTPIAGPQNPQVAALQEAARRLAMRFPLDKVPLKKC